jgi:SAM-dependent methyltransferase
MPLVGDGDFRAVGQEYFHYFIHLVGLQPTHSVLDVGCGLGRMALPLTTYLAPASPYVGFDIEPEAIAWCQRRISRRFPNFQFIRIKAANPNYIAAGLPDALPTFPAADRAIDFAIVTSVFTHLLAREVAHYLAELSRVLKPGGRAFLTFFLLNDESEALIDSGHSRYRFVHRFGDQRVINPRLPQAAIAYPEQQVHAWLKAFPLKLVDRVHYGNWCGRGQFTDGQDILIVEKL